MRAAHRPWWRCSVQSIPVIGVGLIATASGAATAVNIFAILALAATVAIAGVRPRGAPLTRRMEAGESDVRTRIAQRW